MCSRCLKSTSIGGQWKQHVKQCSVADRDLVVPLWHSTGKHRVQALVADYASSLRCAWTDKCVGSPNNEAGNAGDSKPLQGEAMEWPFSKCLMWYKVKEYSTCAVGNFMHALTHQTPCRPPRRWMCNGSVFTLELRVYSLYSTQFLIK